MGDMLGTIKGAIVNYVVRNKKKLVPRFNLPGAVRFNDAVAQGRRSALRKPEIKGDDVAVLQYTGGTTGVSKGAVLLHRNIIAGGRRAGAGGGPGGGGGPPGGRPAS